ncbi:MAG: kelch repeat-containing protein, partial [Deltaproteobacteria bacterium]|nr:kelch repeat-containing protein [Deltaproteobacteria bacterium]
MRVPQTDCGWSDQTNASRWDYDRDVASKSLWTYHCTPEEVTYKHPDHVSGWGDAEKTTYWHWQGEPWWQGLEASLESVDSAQKSAPAQGYVWIRPPQISGVLDDVHGNRYQSVKMKQWMFHIDPNLKKRLPRPGDLVPSLDVTNPLVDPSIAQQMVGAHEPQIGLIGVDPGEASDVGRFGYSAGLVGSNSSLAGLLVRFVDRRTLGVVGGGYSTGSGPGSVPDTKAFSSAWVTITTPVAGSMDMVAVFGGTLADGAPSDRLWLGRFGGLDSEGIPFVGWEEATFGSAARPEARSDAGLFFDKEGGRLILFGGKLADGSAATDVWALDLTQMKWTELDLPEGYEGLANFVTAQAGEMVYVVGGERIDGTPSTLVRIFDFVQGETWVAGDLTAGPGVRTRPAVSLGGPLEGTLFLYGGTDQSGVAHTDLWELDLAGGTWTRTVPDCTGDKCPPSGGFPFIMASRDGSQVALYRSADPNKNLYYLADRANGVWHGSRELQGEPPAMDCNGDGVEDPETTRACKASEEWYAKVGKLTCPEATGQPYVCSEVEPKPMELTSSWSPDCWEWVEDFAVGSEGYVYALVGSEVHVLDMEGGSGILEHVGSVEMTAPGHCGGTEPDDGRVLKIVNGRLFVGTYSGLHVFDLTGPDLPVETAYLPGHGTVRDMAYHRGALYLADDAGITIVDATSPLAPVEAGRVSVGAEVRAIGVNARDNKVLALTSHALLRYDISSRPWTLDYETTLDLPCSAYNGMRVEDRWTYP